MNFSQTTPILRMFDEGKTREFYLDYLGFTVDWEHRFEPDMPLYMQVSRAGCVLHLTEHHGACSPGAAMRIQTSDVRALHQELSAKQYGDARPGIECTPWETEDLSITDPFGNRLTFTTAVSA
ncbi:MAG: glyoxalase superfamily protein [Rubripirellula sp.]